MNDHESLLADHPVDIFGMNPARSGKVYKSADTPEDNHSGRMNGSRIALKSRTNKPHLVVQIPKPVAESISTSENSIRTRRFASHTDHPLKCHIPVRVQDADDLDLENKIRSALSRRPILPSRSTAHKSVRWADPCDPAIVSCGPKAEPLISNAEPEPAIQKDGSPLKNCVKTIVSLKRHDRLKLRELLDALSRIEEANSSIAHPETTSEKPRLDPRAPKFTSSLREAHTRSENLKACDTWSASYAPKPKLPLIWMRTSQHPLIVDPVPTIPGVRPYKPIPIVSRNATIPQDGHGREAKVLDPEWAESILEKFVARYPLTGKLKAAAPAGTKGRLAATIQQRLEYLLMENREKKGVEKNIAEKEREVENR